MKKVRGEALDIARRADEMVIIGVKPILNWADDVFVSEILRIPVPKITYVAGGADGESDGATIRSIHRCAHTIAGGFREYLEVERSRRRKWSKRFWLWMRTRVSIRCLLNSFQTKRFPRK